MLVVLHLLPLKDYPVLRFLLFMIPYLTVGYDILRKAWKGILNHQVFDECFLMAVATIGAMILGEYSEGVAVMLFYQIGELFQSIAVGKSRRSISELMDIRPDYANLEQDGEVEKVDPDEVEVGSIIVIRPGEKVPIDGIVVEGSSSLNTSALTGESLPRDVKPGDEIISGSVNMSGLLRVETTKEFDESTASKILELVENAGERKAKSEQFISKFARWYTPAVCYSALALAVLGPLVSILVFHRTSDWALWSDWIYRALTFLVISCPCAIVVSVPLSFFGGIGGASNQGILIKGSNFMETLANVKYIVMDKTGTITKGNFEVTAVHDEREHNIDDAHMLELAALAESHSSHPIASSIRRAYEAEGAILDKGRVTDVQEVSGKGVIAAVDALQVAAGNLKLMKMLGVACEACRSVGTIVYVASRSEAADPENGQPAGEGSVQAGGSWEYLGHIVISDEIKPGAADAIRQMKQNGIVKAVMLTGDITSMAESVAREVGIDEVHAELLPEDKVTLVEKLLAEKKAAASPKATLAFVGDGINDAPVLAIADLGIAMGALGSDAAIEAADVVLMDDDPAKIVKAMRIARKCIRIVNENIWFAIGVKFACLLLGALGIANMWLAIFADVGVMVLCVLNSVRALL
ncbi:MAG: heavy metal translocating P-type ATPase [Lachnospiraceae bacterium]|nr:heavy metal translocating P-type ATPase [Lachnospiraceae bacterium]